MGWALGWGLGEHLVHVAVPPRNLDHMRSVRRVQRETPAHLTVGAAAAAA